MRRGLCEGCIHYGTQFEPEIERDEEFTRFRRYPIYDRFNRHFPFRRRWFY